ncbi:MAG TPA: VWA domain-containing protein [Methylomirabilota bacterium]|nr:VWA domain-containing protein [Methylomirabilota bacterium]
MIHWGAPQLLWLLVVVPALSLLLLLGAWLKRRALRSLADPALVPRLTDSRSARWAAVKVACVLSGLALMVVAAARPQWGEKLQVVKGHGIDVVIALDASRSMLAADIPPSRLERAKVQIASLLDNLSGNRVGIVAFAGDAQVMCPLTTDVEAAKLFLDIIDPGNMPRPGTNLQHAVEAAASLFGPAEESSKALVLITDGDNLDGDPGVATRIAVENHIRMFAVGVGTPEGSTIPEAQSTGTSYQKDADGKIVMSRLGERLLLVMAKATDGRYFRSESINLDALVGALDQVQKKAISGGEYVEYEERYQSFLLPAFLLLFAGILISDRRGAWFPEATRPFRALARRWPRGRGARSTSHVAALIALGLLAAAPARADVGSSMRRGLALEKAGKYADAAKAYQEALVLEPDNVRIRYNLGRVMYEQQQFPEAADHFQLGLLSKQKTVRAHALYNLANTHFKAGRLDDAIGAYSLALLQDPSDLEAKQNLELCWKIKQEMQQHPDTSKKPQQQQHQQPQQQQGQPQPQPQGQQAQAQPAPKGSIPKEQADRMLQALQSKERENLKKQPKPPQSGAPGGKDW